MTKSHNPIVGAIGKMPFHGRNWIKGTYREGSDAANSGRPGVCLRKADEIDTWSVEHNRKALIGLGITAVGLVRFAESGNDTSFAMATITGLYGLANALVGYSQHALANRLREKVPAETVGAHVNMLTTQTENGRPLAMRVIESNVVDHSKEPATGDAVFTYLGTAAYYGAAVVTFAQIGHDICDAAFRN